MSSTQTSWTLDYSSLDLPKAYRAVPSPPGFTPPTSSSRTRRTTTPSISVSAAKNLELSRLKEKRAWDLAIGPGKALFTTAFMMYMSGSGVQIFSLGIVFMTIWGAVKGAVGVNQVFAPLRTSTTPTPNPPPSYTPQKVLYLLCQLAALLLGVYKADRMGLVPTRAGDWVEFWARTVPREVSPGSVGVLY